MDIDEQILALIAKKLEGQANEAELSQLQAWLQDSEAHRVEYAKLASVSYNINALLTTPAFDTDAAWIKVNTLINNSAKANRPKPAFLNHLFYYKHIAAAAAVALFCIAGFYLWNNSRASLQAFTAANANQLITLPDNSTVLLRKGSTLYYPTAFAAKERRVELDGEAFFNVYHNEQQPFLIITANAKVRVLGTSFLVRSKKLRDEIVVITGKVSVTDKEKVTNQLLLAAGQMAILQSDQFKQTAIKDSNYIAWKNGLLEFKDASLPKVLEDVAQYYDVPLELAAGDSATVENIHINVRFQRQSLAQVLEEITLITGLETKTENGKTVFYLK